jgi:anti-anti-sigma factor
MSAPSTPSQPLRLERHGAIAVIIPSMEVESMRENQMQQAAQQVLDPLGADPPAGLIIDLTGLGYFGSVFISFLLSCHKLVKPHGSKVILVLTSDRIRQLLHLTNLDGLWPMYRTQAEAINALSTH